MQKLTKLLPQAELIDALAHKVKSRFTSSDGKCEYMAEEMVKELRSRGIRAEHVMGIFTLDEPGAWRYRSDEDEEFDEYEVNHDWVSVEGKILDISADQFRKYVHIPIPDVVYISYSDPLYRYYREMGYV